MIWGKLLNFRAAVVASVRPATQDCGEEYVLHCIHRVLELDSALGTAPTLLAVIAKVLPALTV